MKKEPEGFLKTITDLIPVVNKVYDFFFNTYRNLLDKLIIIQIIMLLVFQPHSIKTLIDQLELTKLKETLSPYQEIYTIIFWFIYLVILLISLVIAYKNRIHGKITKAKPGSEKYLISCSGEIHNIKNHATRAYLWLAVHRNGELWPKKRENHEISINKNNWNCEIHDDGTQENIDIYLYALDDDKNDEFEKYIEDYQDKLKNLEKEAKGLNSRDYQKFLLHKKEYKKRQEDIRRRSSNSNGEKMPLE